MDILDSRSGEQGFELPCGLFKDGKILKHVILKEITGEEEDILAAEDVNGIIKLNRVLGNCIVSFSDVGKEQKPPKNDNAKKAIDASASNSDQVSIPLANIISDKQEIRNLVPELTIGDRIFILLCLRIISLGENFIFDTECSKCKKSFKRSIDLTTLPTKEMKDPTTLLYSLELPSGKTVKMRVATGKEELILSKMKINATDIMTKSLSIRTETVGNEEASVLLLKKLSLKDRNKMRDSIDKYEGGVETEIEIECPECGDVSVSDLDIGQSSFFFPSE